MRGNIIASIAVFKSLYSKDQGIYSVLARFVTATINLQNLRSFDVTTLRLQLKENFGIEVYDSVLKTVIRQRLKGSITKSDSDTDKNKGIYYATPSAEDFEEFNRQLLEQTEKYQFVFQELISHYRNKTSQPISDQDIIDSFTNFLLSDSNSDPGHIFSRFMLSKENDKDFVACLNEVKEGSIIMAGLKDISDSTDMNTIGSWTDKLTIYLDTEELFSAYGYNGELFQQILNDFLSLVKEANKKAQNIELKYLDETKNVIDGYFGQAERIIDGKGRADGKTAMNTILSKCRAKGDVAEERGKFYAFLLKSNIQYDERSSYVGDMSGNLQTTEILEAIKADLTASTLTMSDNDISKYLRIFSIINHKRHSEHKTSFEKCRCVLLSENSIPRYIAWHPSIHDEGAGFTYSTTMDYAVSRLWFRLHKGLVGKIPASMDVMNRVKIIMASLLNQSIQQKYDELRSKKYTAEEQISIYNEIRAHEVYPEEINNDNVEELISFTEISDVETLRREKALDREKVKQGEKAIAELAEIKRNKRRDVKRKIKRKLYHRKCWFNTIWGMICIGLGVGVYFGFHSILSPQDTKFSIWSLVISCIPSVVSLISWVRRRIISYRDRMICKRRRILLQKYLKQ